MARKTASAASGEALHIIELAMPEGSNAALPGFIAFRQALIPRTKINPAVYNPRVMDQSAGKRLRESVQKGLVEPLVWNDHNGTLIGGHQRLRQMDTLTGYPDKKADYHVPCAVVTITDKQAEIEQNIRLNSPNLQGQFDLGGLTDLFESLQANPFEAGFTALDLELDLGPDLATQMQEAWGDTSTTADLAEATGGDLDSLQETEDAIQKIKAAKRVQVAADQGNLDPGHILHLVYRSRADLMETLDYWGVARDKRFIDIDSFGAIMESKYREMLYPDIRAEVLEELGIKDPEPVALR